MNEWINNNELIKNKLMNNHKHSFFRGGVNFSTRSGSYYPFFLNGYYASVQSTPFKDKFFHNQFAPGQVWWCNP